MNHRSLLTWLTISMAVLAGACVTETAQVDPPFEATAGAKLVALGDLNSDGWMDVVSTSGDSQPIQIHLRDPLTLAFQTYTVAGGAPLTNVNRIEVVDMDQDGKLDIVALITDTGFVPPDNAQKEGTLAILFQGDDPRQAASWTQIPTAGQSPVDNLALPSNNEGAGDMVVGDFDGSNGPDIVVLSNEEDTTKVKLFANPGAVMARDQTQWSAEVIDNDVVTMGKAGTADIDSDGDLDVVLSAPAAKSFNVRWLANPRFDPPTISGNPVPTFVRQDLDSLAGATAGAAAVALGDIDGDGWTDVASISDESQPVQVHMQDPYTLSFTTYSIAGGAPLSKMKDIALADMDFDGKLDIVVLVNDTGFVPPNEQADFEGTVVLLFQGDDPTNPAEWRQIPAAGRSPPDNISFASKGSGVTAMTIADFDQANGLDIAVVSNEFDYQHLRLFANPGPARARDVSAWQSINIEADVAELASVASADVDEDGDTDIVLSAPEAKSFNLRWLANPKIRTATDDPNPVPTFVPDQIDPVFEVTAGAQATALGDINNDGEMDIVSISDESQPVQIHFRNTAGKFDTLSIAGGLPLARMVDLALADFNGDNKLDIAVLVNNTGKVRPGSPCADQREFIGALVLLIQGGDSHKAQDWTWVFDKDDLDYCNQCSVPEGCDMMLPYILGHPPLSGPTDLEVGDFNEDGLPDIVLTLNYGADEDEPRSSNFVYHYPNPGAMNVTSRAEWNHTVIDSDRLDDGDPYGPAYSRLAVADIDNDNHLDVVASLPSAVSFNLRWIRNVDAAASWTRELVGQQLELQPGLDRVITKEVGADVIAVGDIDGDGDIDVAASSARLMETQWFRNPGQDALPPLGAQVPWDVFSVGAVTSSPIDQVHLVDLDNDGMLDCFLSAAGIGYGFRRNPDNLEHTWISFAMFVADPTAQIGRVSFFDFDNDGKLDVVAPFDRPGLLNDQMVLYRSVAGSLWLRKLVGQQQSGGQKIAVDDVDGDGHMDVVAASEQDGLVQWFMNPGPDRLLPISPQVPWNVYNIGSAGVDGVDQIELVDLDNDGKLDCFFTANGYGVGFRRQVTLATAWEQFGLFSTDPPATVGRAGFDDFDGDGKTDFVVPFNREGLLSDEFAVFLSFSGSIWQRRLVGQQNGGGDFVSLADINSDGNVDVAVASVKDGVVQWFRNPGQSALLSTSPQLPWDVFNVGGLSSIVLNEEPQEGQINQLQITDLNADGRPDAFITASGTAYVFLSNIDVTAPWSGRGIFTASPPATLGPVGIWDFDLNGLPDIVVPVDREGLTEDGITLFQR